MQFMHVARHAFKKVWLAHAAVLLALVWSIAAPGTAHALSGSTIINLTNNQRISAGLTSLNQNSKLSASANAKARDMLANNYWAHTSPDGKTPWTFINQTGYAYVAAGENLAKGYSSDQAVINAWMASPTHRANILNANYRDIGIGIVSGTLSGVQTTVVVAHYGTTTSVAPIAAAQPAAPKPAPAPVAAKVSPKPQPVAPAETKPAPEAPKEETRQLEVAGTSEIADQQEPRNLDTGFLWQILKLLLKPLLIIAQTQSSRVV